jgi:hypothetical protein
MEVPDGLALAGPAGTVREVEHGIQTLRPLGEGRYLAGPAGEGAADRRAERVSAALEF